MRSSVSKCAKRAQNAPQTFDYVTKFDLHPSVGLSPIAS